MKRNGRLPLNMKFFIEGEEEVGSLHLDQFVHDNKQMLAADVVVISDSAMFDRDVPSICYGLRGLVYYQIDLRGTRSDLHSGIFGGAVANPAFVLAQVLAQMKDKKGQVKIAGFYDDVRALTPAEREEWKKLPFDEKKYRKDLGAPKLFGESGLACSSRAWGQPTFEVNGLLSGWTGGVEDRSACVGDGQSQHAPRADQQPDKIAKLFEAYVETVTPGTVELKATRMHGGKPRMAFDDPYPVRPAAPSKAFGKTPVFSNREGGSIPVMRHVSGRAGYSESVLFGVGLPDDNPRAERELDLRNFTAASSPPTYLSGDRSFAPGA